MALRVLHVGKYFHPSFGGMENFLFDLLEASAKLGVEQACLVHAAKGQARESGTSKNYPFLERLERVRVYGRLSYAPISPGVFVALDRLIDKFRPNVLHLHLPNTSAFAALFSRKARRIPWIIHWHADVLGPGIDYKLRLLYPFYRPFEQALLRQAKRVVATSPPYLESSEALSPWKSKCSVIPLGLNPERILSNHGDYPPPVDGKPLQVLAVGRLTRYKGFENLIQAASELASVDVSIVGAGELDKKLSRQIKDLSLNDRVRLFGAISDEERNRLIHHSDVVCLPSINRAEAFGVILLEAMASRKPVVVADVPGSGMSWVTRPDVSGLVYPCQDVGALVTALRRMRDSRKLRLTMGRGADQNFEERFHIRPVAHEIYQLQRSVALEKNLIS